MYAVTSPGKPYRRRGLPVFTPGQLYPLASHPIDQPPFAYGIATSAAACRRFASS
jgi:hypothetical protein